VKPPWEFFAQPNIPEDTTSRARADCYNYYKSGRFGTLGRLRAGGGPFFADHS
jgi:hypothetical protein